MSHTEAYSGRRDPINAPINQPPVVCIECGKRREEHTGHSYRPAIWPDDVQSSVEDEVAAIARQYAQGIVNCMRPSSGVRVEDFEPILAEACKKSAIVAALHAGEIIEKLRDERNEGMRWLRKYQARYHGAEHAQKLWNHVEEFLNRKR